MSLSAGRGALREAAVSGVGVVADLDTGVVATAAERQRLTRRAEQNVFIGEW
jgi:hypothetical protein